MKTAVIIPCYNSEKNIDSALQSLADQEVLPDEIILIDNGSTDNTIKKIDGFIKVHPALNIIFTKESKKGPAAARNRGINVSVSDVLAFMDSDCLAEKDWVKNIKELFRNDSVMAVGGVTRIYKPVNPVEKLQAIDELYSNKVHNKGKIRKSNFLQGDFPVTNNAAYRANPIKMLGGFDENYGYPYGEDAELYLRLVEKLKPSDGVLLQQEQVKMWHRPRKTFFLLAKQIFSYRYALGRLLKDHLKGKAFIRLPIFGVFEFYSPFLTIWVDAPILVLISFLFLCFMLKNITIYLILAGFLLFFLDIYKRTKVLGFSETLLNLVFIGVVSLAKKVISEIGRIYGAIKYRVISI